MAQQYGDPYNQPQQPDPYYNQQDQQPPPNYSVGNTDEQRSQYQGADRSYAPAPATSPDQSDPFGYYAYLASQQQQNQDQYAGFNQQPQSQSQQQPDMVPDLNWNPTGYGENSQQGNMSWGSPGQQWGWDVGGSNPSQQGQPQDSSLGEVLGFARDGMFGGSDNPPNPYGLGVSDWAVKNGYLSGPGPDGMYRPTQLGLQWLAQNTAGRGGGQGQEGPSGNSPYANPTPQQGGMPQGLPSPQQVQSGGPMPDFRRYLEDPNAKHPGWNQGEAFAPGTPEFARHPQSDADWQARYYYAQQHPEMTAPDWTPRNQWYQQNDPQALQNLSSIAGGQLKDPYLNPAAAMAQLYQWGKPYQGSVLEPGGQSNANYTGAGKVHMTNGDVYDAGNNQFLYNERPRPQPFAGGGGGRGGPLPPPRGAARSGGGSAVPSRYAPAPAGRSGTSTGGGGGLPPPARVNPPVQVRQGRAGLDPAPTWSMPPGSTGDWPGDTPGQQVTPYQPGVNSGPRDEYDTVAGGQADDQAQEADYLRQLINSGRATAADVSRYYHLVGSGGDGA